MMQYIDTAQYMPQPAYRQTLLCYGAIRQDCYIHAMAHYAAK